MVMDFKHLKKLCQVAIVDQFDHSIVLERSDPFLTLLANMRNPGRFKEFDERPTAENMVLFALASFIKELRNLNSYINVTHVRIRLWETKDSYATSGWVNVYLGGGPE
jgi:6-pyruvoyl-tetrahydropterin synthase